MRYYDISYYVVYVTRAAMDIASHFPQKDEQGQQVYQGLAMILLLLVLVARALCLVHSG